MTRFISCLHVAATISFLTVASAGCSDPVAVHRDATTIHVNAEADTVGFDRTLQLEATSLDAAGDTLTVDRATWASSDNNVFTVTSDGIVRGIRPGRAYARVMDGIAHDSVLLTVVTSFCDRDLELTSGSAFTNGFIGPGTLRGGLRYQGDPIMEGAGVAFGNDPMTAVLTYNDMWFPPADPTTGGVCKVNDGVPLHTVSVVHAIDEVPHDPTPMTAIAGLVMVQDQYAYTNAEDDDYLLFRYTLTNYGASPVEHFTFGMYFNFDLYLGADDQSLFRNVGSLDAASVASVISADSANQPRVAGVAILNANAGTYLAHFLPGQNVHRDQFYSYLTGGMVGPLRTPSEDVRQMLAAQPFDIPAGGTTTIWIAIVAGESRAAFDANLAAARAKIVTIQ